MPYHRDNGLDPYLVSQVDYHAKTLQHHPLLQHTPLVDLKQTLLLHFFLRQHTYDPDKAKWSTFVDMVLNCVHKRLIRDTGRERRGVGIPHDSLETLLAIDEEGTHSAWPTHLIQESSASDLACDLSRLQDKLPDDLAALLLGLQSSTPIDIARRTNTPYFTVRQQLKRLRSALIEHGLHIYWHCGE